jgi:hypothetical protein
MEDQVRWMTQKQIKGKREGKENEVVNGLPSLQLTLKREMCYFSSVTTQNRTPGKAENFSSCWVRHGRYIQYIQHLSYEIRHHLHNPIFINKKIWGLQITVYYYGRAVVQIIHSPSLKV